jgi:hypothetical protein
MLPRLEPAQPRSAIGGLTTRPPLWNGTIRMSTFVVVGSPGTLGPAGVGVVTRTWTRGGSCGCHQAVPQRVPARVLLGSWSAPGRTQGCGRSGRFMPWVVSEGQEPAAGRAPVDRAGWPARLLPPGDPQLPTPRWCRLAPWARSMHRVISRSVVGLVRRTWSSSPPGSRSLVGGPCRVAWSATGPVTVVWPPATARRVAGPGWLTSVDGVTVRSPSRFSCVSPWRRRPPGWCLGAAGWSDAVGAGGGRRGPRVPGRRSAA